MTIGILRRLLQILSLLGALALLLALARVVPAVAPASTDAPASQRVRIESGAPRASAPAVGERGGASRVAPNLAQLPPTSRAWQSAGTALAATAALVLPAAVLALIAGTLVGVLGATAVSPAVRSAVAILSAVALAVPALLTARFAASTVDPVPASLFAMLAGSVADAPWAALLASPAALACVLAMVAAVTPGIAEATSAVARSAAKAPWMRFARAQGIRRGRQVTGLLRPVLLVAAAALVGRVLALLLAVACVVENVVGWPGIGHLLVASIAASDLAVSGASLVAILAVLAVGRGLAIAASRALDPVRKGSV